MLERPMSKAEWTRVRFDQIATQINDRVDNPAEAGVDRYVGLEHLDPDSLRIRRWGEPTDVESTKLRFQPGDIIFGKRRVYQRKVAVADFEGICSAHAMVLRAKPGAMLPDFLPFFMQSDLFMERALSISVGSLSPTINWKALAAEEFLLPPIQEQARLVEAFLSFDNACEALRELSNKSRDLLFSTSTELLHQHTLLKLTPASTSPAPGWRNVAFNDVCERITYGFTNPMPTTDAGPWMVTAKDVVDGVIDYTSARHTSRDAFETELTEKSRVRIGDVLLTKDGTLGRVAVVDRDDVCINQSVAVLRPNEQSNGVFLSRVLRAPQMQARLMKDSGGSAVKHLYITKVGETRFFLPSIEEQARISGILNGLEEHVNASEKRLSQLNGLKKSILEGEVYNAL